MVVFALFYIAWHYLGFLPTIILFTLLSYGEEE